jgi:hypothetical protein
LLDGALLEEAVRELSVQLILLATAIIACVTLAAHFHKKKGEEEKWVMFLGIVAPAVAVTTFLSGSTIYLNHISETGGPVHWHADFEVWKCGKKVDLLDPTGIENRIGTPVLHEHNDFRVHVEGTVVKKSDISLGKFFDVIGGSMTAESLTVPTNDGTVTMSNGEECGGKEAKLQTFVYKVTNPGDLKKWVFVQEKLKDAPSYVLSPFSTIPPGDCIIVELDEEKDMTDKICETTRVAIQRGELSGS